MSTWYSGPATIRQRGSDVAVQCSITAYQDMVDVGGGDLLEGLKSWEGTWWDPEPQYTLDLDEATIRLPNGREGHIIIGDMQVRMPGGEHGTLRGSGALPA